MMLFHIGHLVALINVMVRTADTNVLIIALANIGKLGACINVWLEMILYMNNTLRYMNVNKLQQALGNSFRIALPEFQALIGSNYTGLLYRKNIIRPPKFYERSDDGKKSFLCFKRDEIGMKSQPVHPRQVSPYDYMWKLNFAWQGGTVFHLVLD